MGWVYWVFKSNDIQYFILGCSIYFLECSIFFTKVFKAYYLFLFACFFSRYAMALLLSKSHLISFHFSSKKTQLIFQIIIKIWDTFPTLLSTNPFRSKFFIENNLFINFSFLSGSRLFSSSVFYFLFLSARIKKVKDHMKWSLFLLYLRNIFLFTIYLQIMNSRYKGNCLYFYYILETFSYFLYISKLTAGL